jgi:hypothetical protein
LGIAAAPPGLALVQNLLNTRDVGGKVPDLLASPNSAGDWLMAELARHPAETSGGVDRFDPTQTDLDRLRELRREVTALLHGADAVPREHTVSASLVITPGGEVRLDPVGTGWRRFSSAVWAEVFLAQQNDTWRRLKLCRNAPCSSAFYDRSKNNSGVWHDVKMCGNAANLRASRARRRAAGTRPGEGQPR